MTIQHILQQKQTKEELIYEISMIPEYFNELVKFSFSNNPACWRALWIMQHTIHINNHRDIFINQLDNYLEVFPNQKDGFQRIFIQLIFDLKLQESAQMICFDLCLTIWKDIRKSSALRFVAIKFLINHLKHQPDLKNEILLYSNSYYLENLSPGIQKITQNLLKKQA